jgi:hypothetical protein
MQILASGAVEPAPATPAASPKVLGKALVLDLEAFPELNWLPQYFATLQALHHQHEQLSSEIQAVAQSGNVYHDQWLEPYSKTRNGKQYTYHQLRWLTGERKQSGQPKVKTKHLSHRAVPAVQAAIARGKQVEALEKEQRQVEAELERMKHLVRGTSRRLQRVLSQNPNLREGNSDDQ